MINMNFKKMALLLLSLSASYAKVVGMSDRLRNEYPPYMLEEMEQEKAAKTSLNLRLKDPLLSDMQDAIRELDYEAAQDTLKGVSKLSPIQAKALKALLNRKYESLKREAFALQDEGDKPGYNHATFQVLPVFYKIRDLILSKE